MDRQRYGAEEVGRNRHIRSLQRELTSV
jgi:hypothetical protein